jgi:biotin--protein ligase
MPKIVEALKRDDAQRIDFLRACLSKLGLEVNKEQTVVPSLSRLHLSSMKPSTPENIMASLAEIITTVDGEDYIKDENDTFHLEKQSAWSLSSLKSTIIGDSDEDETGQSADTEDRILDYNEIVKRLLVHEKNYPSSKETPYFNHDAFFANVRHYQSKEAGIDPAFGRHLLYGEVVTSTNTILEK